MKSVILLFLLFSLSFSNYIVSGNILGLSGKHPIIVNIYNEESWLNRKVLQQRVIPTTESIKNFDFMVPTNDYGIVVIEDKDKNGKMSFGLFGPSEPMKVYTLNKIVFGPPNFNDFKFNVSKNITDIVISFK